jgi:hypothetical protein
VLVIMSFGLVLRVIVLVGTVFAGVLVFVDSFVSGVIVLMRMLVRMFVVVNVFVLVRVHLVAVAVFVGVLVLVFVGMNVLVLVLAFHGFFSLSLAARLPVRDGTTSRWRGVRGPRRDQDNPIAGRIGCESAAA